MRHTTTHQATTGEAIAKMIQEIRENGIDLKICAVEREPEEQPRHHALSVFSREPRDFQRLFGDDSDLLDGNSWADDAVYVLGCLRSEEGFLPVIESDDDGEVLITICGDYDPDTEDLAWTEVQIGHTWEGTHWSFDPRPNGILLSPEQIDGELEYAFAEHLGYEAANHAAD